MKSIQIIIGEKRIKQKRIVVIYDTFLQKYKLISNKKIKVIELFDLLTNLEFSCKHSFPNELILVLLKEVLQCVAMVIEEVQGIVDLLEDK